MRCGLFRSRTRTPRLPARSITKKRSEPLASTVGWPLVSGASSRELTGFPWCVTPLPAPATNRTACPLRMKVPQRSGRAGLSSTSALLAARPKLLLPSRSQKSPASVSQPLSLVSASTRCARHLPISARSACGSTVLSAAAAGAAVLLQSSRASATERTADKARAVCV